MIALSTRTPNASMSRQSAEIWSPCSNKTMSPGTSCSMGSWAALPSRTTVACWGSSWRNAASVCSARYSCQNENTALTRITTTMAYPTFAIPSPGALHSAKNASAAATHRISAKKWVSPLRKRSSGCSRRHLFHMVGTEFSESAPSFGGGQALRRTVQARQRVRVGEMVNSIGTRALEFGRQRVVHATYVCPPSCFQTVCTNARRRSVSVMIPTRRPPSTTGSAPNP